MYIYEIYLFFKISEMQTEREHMKNEVNDMRQQYQLCLQEVSDFELKKKKKSFC